MPRVLNVALILYLPLLIAAAIEFAAGFRQDRIGTPIFIALFLALVLTGSAAFVCGLGVAKRVMMGDCEPRAAWGRGFEALIGLIAGLPPFLVLTELAWKLFLYLGL